MPVFESLGSVRSGTAIRLAGVACLIFISLGAVLGAALGNADARPPAVDQYVEQLPSGGGGRPAGGGGGSVAEGAEGRYQMLLESRGRKGLKAAAIFGELGLRNPKRKERESVDADAASDETSIGEILDASYLGGSGAGLLVPISMLAIVILGLLVRQLGLPPQARGPSASD